MSSSVQNRGKATPLLKPTFQVLVTTYELCMMDAHFLSRFEWGLCIVDEAHRLKSQTSKLYERERTCLMHQLLTVALASGVTATSPCSLISLLTTSYC